VSQLSIVTPIYNPGPYLQTALDSVAAVPVAHEHVVVDGGSTDGTVDVLQSHRDSGLRWISEADRGQTDAVNKGIHLARGDLLMWVNGDDEVVPEGISRAVEHFERHPECDVVYGGLDFTDANGVVQREYVPGSWCWRRYLFLGDYIPEPTIIWRRSRMERVGLLDERWVDAADYDFFLRLTHRAHVQRLDTPHVRFRFHSASKSARDVWTQMDEALAIRLGWARNARDQAVMIGLDELKRRLLPTLTRGRWPAPF
jgi:glycosyltransferase involved in cell wall biosynthesis